jgi:hypothetical protein
VPDTFTVCNTLLVSILARVKVYLIGLADSAAMPNINIQMNTPKFFFKTLIFYLGQKKRYSKYCQARFGSPRLFFPKVLLNNLLWQVF